MDIVAADYLLTTTRSVKKRLDFTRPVDPGVIEECIAVALQAPTSFAQGWRFLVVTDPDKRAALAGLYQKAYQVLRDARRSRPPSFEPGERLARLRQRVLEASDYLCAHLHQVPVLVIGCIETRVKGAPDYWPQEFQSFRLASLYGAILPAAWSLMLALRARGLGSAWTTAHLVCEKEVAGLLGIPEHVIQAVLLPVAYFKGEDFKPAERLPVREVTYWNGWGQSG